MNKQSREVLFSSKNMKFETPQNLFDLLNKEFNFNLDVCAEDSTAKCKKYFTEKEDALIQDWNGVCYMNPPYGRKIGKWLEKAYKQSLKGNIIVCLIPSRTCTKYWHDYVMKSSEIRFIKGRLKFGDCKENAPFPSCIVIFDKNKQVLKTTTFIID